MPFTKTPRVLLALTVLSFIAPGCGGPPPDAPEALNRRNELGEIYDMYTLYVKRYEKPPQQPADLLSQKAEQLHPAGARVLKNKDYVVVWGVDVKNGSAVLAYEKDAPKQGGAVLMADGSIRKFSAEELQAALPHGK